MPRSYLLLVGNLEQFMSAYIIMSVGCLVHNIYVHISIYIEGLMED